jgi:hypothetical protein
MQNITLSILADSFSHKLTGTLDQNIKELYLRFNDEDCIKLTEIVYSHKNKDESGAKCLFDNAQLAFSFYKTSFKSIHEDPLFKGYEHSYAVEYAQQYSLMSLVNLLRFRELVKNEYF